MHYLQLTISYRYDSTSSGLSEEDLADWLISELGTVGFSKSPASSVPLCPVSSMM